MHKNVIVMDRGYHSFSPMQFGWEACAPSHSYGPAVRSHWLLHYIVRGKGRFHREGKVYELSAGDLFIIEPEMETYYEADSFHPWEYIWIGFTADDGMPCCFNQAVISCVEAGKVFLEMKRCAERENGRSAFLAARIWDLVALLQEQGRGPIGYVEQAIQCMQAEYPHGITVSEIADRLNLDRSYFSNYFKKETGRSPQQYLIDLRMERAAFLLRKERLRPTVVAASTGFSDLFTFSKAFKKYFGVSPREYQNKVAQ
ncbi:MAG: AraC family transcriptional regulator [Clostridia bacterium]|nr:AraC family transcriptional regulator [Clostridia bacterium]